MPSCGAWQQLESSKPAASVHVCVFVRPEAGESKGKLRYAIAVKWHYQGALTGWCITASTQRYMFSFSTAKLSSWQQRCPAEREEHWSFVRSLSSILHSSLGYLIKLDIFLQSNKVLIDIFKGKHNFDLSIAKISFTLQDLAKNCVAEQLTNH